MSTLDTFADDMPSAAAYVAKARKAYASDDVEIDDNPRISTADGGMWVQAWVWVGDEDLDEGDDYDDADDDAVCDACGEHYETFELDASGECWKCTSDDVRARS